LTRPALDAREIASALRPDGPIARGLLHYEHRPEQVGMAERVAETFARGGVLAVEAGTGTGKSLAYLVPAIHWSRSAGERVIVSTQTINLQEQLVGVDLPLLAAHLGVPFRAALVKGRGNYVCLRKAAEARESPALLLDGAIAAEIRSILDWSDATADGSLADLPFVPRPDAWDAVVAEHDDCLRTRCPEYERCFFYKARRDALGAELLVVNHHLLLSDLELRSVLGDDAASGVLPAATRLVVDEAHHLEDVTTDHFGAEVSERRIERLLWRLQHPRLRDRGVLPALQQKLAKLSAPEDRLTAQSAAKRIEETLRARIPELGRQAAAAFSRMLLEVAPLVPRGVESEEQRLRITAEVHDAPAWRATEQTLRDLIRAVDGFAEAIEPVLERVSLLSQSAVDATVFLAKQLEAVAGRLSAVALDLGHFLADDRELCRWFAVRRRGSQAPALILAYAPVEAGPRLRDTLFQAFSAAVLTSATLTVERRFDYFAGRVGLDLLPEGTVERLRLDSPYHFADQAMIAVPADVPAPDAPGYEPALFEVIGRAVDASGGGAFLLFTSHAALTRAHEALAARLRARGLPVWRQGEAGRSAILDRFRRDHASVLFATDSFWEGVDVRGEGLRLIVIGRLPFRMPNDPIVLARSEAIEARGGNAFDDYALPQAVIKLRQGFGRLVRSHEDSGVVLIADSRIARKAYGEVFLSSLPPARLAVGETEEVLAAVAKFFRRAR
jgi:ATP-dependent DNA helicase DinG